MREASGGSWRADDGSAARLGDNARVNSDQWAPDDPAKEHDAGGQDAGENDTVRLPAQPSTTGAWAPLPASEPGPDADTQPTAEPAPAPSGGGQAAAAAIPPGAPPPVSPETPVDAPYAMPVPPVPQYPQRLASASRRVPPILIAFLMVVSLLLGVIIGLVSAPLLDAGSDEGLPAAGSGVASRAPDSVAGIAAAVLPSVVYIEVSSGATRSSGSGFVIRDDGYLLTNNHVVAPAANSGTVTVVFADGSQERAEIVGRTVDYDLAVLRVDRRGLTPLVLGDSSALAVGDPVVAVGAPLGLEGTVTAGIISALNRPVTAGLPSDASFINAIQTDAAINPGNSGGPLVDRAGEVIGINSAIAQTSGSAAAGNIGLGFAIPSSQARRTAEELIATGQATYPVIGVLLDGSYSGPGVQVSRGSQNGQAAVTPGGPAEQAGLRAGDVILRVDDVPVTEPDELIVAIRARAPGDVVTLTVLRDGSESSVEVTLGEAVSN